MADDLLALDLETQSLRPEDGDILCVGLSDASGTTAGPVAHPRDLDALERVIRSPRALAVHDVRMEGTWAEAYFGVRLDGRRVVDTKLLANRVHPGQAANLAALVSRYLPEVSGYKADTEGLIKAGRIMEIPMEDLLRRVAVDAWATFQLAGRLLPQIPEAARPWLAEDVDLALCVERMAKRGLLLDEEEAIRLKEESAKTQETLLERHRPVNLGSSQQVGEHLLGLGCRLSRSHAGNTVVDESVLRRLADQSTDERVRAVCRDVLEYRSAQKLRTTYAEGYARRRSPDGRVRSDLRWPGAVSWRLASSDPNLQNVPVGVRSLFRAKPGCVLLEADFSQAELRIGAAVAPEPVLVDVFKAGGDPHAMLAERIFGAAFTKDQRHHAKTTNFSLMYDGTEYTLMDKFLEQEIVLTRQQAGVYVSSFHSTYRGFGAWTDKTRRTLLDGGEVFSPTAGYRWTLEDALALKQGNQEEALKAVKNWTIQSVPPRWAMRAALRAEREGLDVVLNTHDGLLLEVPAEETISAGRRIGQIMAETAAEDWMGGLPVPADVKAGIDWGHMAPIGGE